MEQVNFVKPLSGSTCTPKSTKLIVMNKKIPTIILVASFALIAIIIAVVLVIFIIRQLPPKDIPIGTDNVSVSQTPGIETPWAYAGNNTRYFYSRIIIIGQNEDKQTVTLKLQFVRMQVGQNLYDHNYYAYVTYNDVVKTDTSAFKDAETKIVAKGFLDKADSTVNNMAQETYSFVMNVNGQAISVEIDDLNSDFIVKNTLDMTRYVSAGKAKVKIANQIFYANAMVDNTYSYDIAKQANTSNLKDVKYTTHSIIMWDQKNNFYLVDVSDVATQNPLYDSHKWLLFKDAETGFVKKSDNCVLNMFSKNGLPDRWTIDIPDINHSKLELKAVNTYGEGLKGSVVGTVKDDSGTRNILGNFVYVDNK
jgi:hypothetical protein